MGRLANVLRGSVELHVPLGMFNAWLLAEDPAAGILFGVGFLGYEYVQDKYKKDQSFKDVFGWLLGFGILRTALLLIGI